MRKGEYKSVWLISVFTVALFLAVSQASARCSNHLSNDVTRAIETLIK